MKESLRKWLNFLISIYLKQEESQLVLPNCVILLLRIQSALLSFSYIYGKSRYYYLDFVSMLVRPQQYLPISEITQYLVMMLCITYVLTILSIIPQTKVFGIFGQLLRSSIINFLFEISQGSIAFITHSFLILISITETIVVQGTLNVATQNFQHTTFSSLDFSTVILNYIIMIFYTYQFPNQIIVIIALILNIIRIITQLLFSSFQNYQTKAILLTIKISSLILIVFWLLDLQIQISAQIVLLPLIYQVINLFYKKQLAEIVCKCYHKTPNNIITLIAFLDHLTNLNDVQVEKPKNGRDRIIYSSLLMLQNNNYEAFMELKQIQDSKLNILQKFKKQIIIAKCLNKISQHILSSQNHLHSMTNAIAQLMASEQANHLIQNDMIDIMKEKVQCLQLLQHHQTYSNYITYYKFIEKVLLFKKKLEQQYKDFCCDKTQSILGFFYGEIINDYLSANSLFSVIALSDDKIKRMAANQDIFSSKMIYLITQFNTNLIIKRSSNDAAGLLHVRNDQLSGLQISYFLPPGIAEHHNQLILNFLKGGESKFMRQLNPSFLYYDFDCQMSSVELLFDISFTDEINFIAFAQPATSELLSLIVNNSFSITCLSKLLISELGIDGLHDNLLNKNVCHILPNFPHNPFHKQVIENTELYLEKHDEQTQSSSHPIVYLTTIDIQIKQVSENVRYYIITFEYLKRQPFYYYSSLSNQSPSISPIRKNEITAINYVLINQESSVNIPYQEETYINNGVTYSLNQLDLIGIDNSPSQFLKPSNEVKLLSTLDYTNLKSTCKQIDIKTGEQKYFSKPRMQSSSYGQQCQQIIIQDGQSSQISSLQGARNSKYYMHFETIWKINELNSFTKHHRLFLIMIVLCVSVQLLIQIIQLVKLNLNLINLASDIDLLQIKNFVYQPLETFLLTRWTIFNYILLRDAGNITQQEYHNLIQFPQSNLNLGYDQLDINLKQVFNRLSLQDFLETTYIPIYEYVNTNMGESYNLSLRNSITILKNVQYTFKMAYEMDGGIVSDSPYVYFQYKNYLPIKNQFQQLNEIVIQDTILRSAQIEEQLQLISIICLSTLAYFFLFSLYYYMKISKRVAKHFQIMQNISPDFIEYEIQHLKRLSEGLNRDQNLLFKYQFQLENKERQIDNSVGKYLLKKRPNSQLQIFNLHNLYYYLFFVVLIFLMAGNTALTFYEGWNYLQKYPDTAKFYKAVSDVGTDVPTMFAQRDVLYSRATIIPYFTSRDCNQLLNEIVDALNRTQIFVQQDYDFNKFIVSQGFRDFFDLTETQDLCKYIPQELQNTSESICQIVMNQNMQRGLQPMLIYIINHISTDMEINQFQKRTQPSYLELEGAFLVSNIIKVINDQFNADLVNETRFYMNLILLHNTIVLIILCFTVIFIIIYVKKKLIEKLHLAQRFVYLLPSKTVILDTNFERNIRQLLQDY